MFSSMYFYLKVMVIVFALGDLIAHVPKGRCSDAAYVAMMGVPVLCSVGVRGDANHSVKEYALTSSLTEQAKKIVLTILNLPDGFQ